MLIIVLVVAVMLAACNNASVKNEETDVSFSGSNTQVTERTTAEEIAEITEISTTETTSAEISTKKQAETSTTTAKHTTTTQKPTTTQKQTTTTRKKEKSTTKKPATTKKATTTKKETTTKKKSTTTKAATCTGNGNHSQACGNMGRWFSSKSEVKAYVDREMKYWADLEDSGKISREEYYKKCPSGYECWSCAYCGKWTGNFKY